MSKYTIQWIKYAVVYVIRSYSINHNSHIDRYDANANDSTSEKKRWKTNFRCALHSATNIRKGEPDCWTKRQPFKVYELLEQPDPQKVDKSRFPAQTEIHEINLLWDRHHIVSIECASDTIILLEFSSCSRSFGTLPQC